MDKKAKTSKENFNFSFSVMDEALAPFTHLKLFNGYNEIVNEGFGNMNIQVPKGLYQLRIELNEHVEDRNYRITDNVSDSLQSIHTASSIPVIGFSTTHEYFSGPSAEWSRKSTTTKKNLNNGSRLFIFLRYSDKERSIKEKEYLGKGFTIINDKREIVCTLNKKNTKSDQGKDSQNGEYFGCVAFHEKFKPGQYYLLYESEKISREIPVYIFNGWQTQLYIMIKDFPLFNTLKITIDKNGFVVDNKQNMQIDALIQKMYNGIYFLPDKYKDAITWLKWDNPMLGILACYMYLLSDDTKDDKLFKIILNNLQDRILNNTTAPDLVALRLLGAIHFQKPIPAEPLLMPCMVVAGMNAFLNQSFKNANLIQENSMVENIFKNLIGDSIWTTYKPLPIKGKTAIIKPAAPQPKSRSKAKNTRTRSAIPQMEIAQQFEFDPKKDWVTSSIFNQLRQLSEDNDPFDVNTIASQMQIPSNTVKTALNKLNQSGNLQTIADSILGKRSKDIKSAMGNIDSNIKKMKF